MKKRSAQENSLSTPIVASSACVLAQVVLNDSAAHVIILTSLWFDLFERRWKSQPRDCLIITSSAHFPDNVDKQGKRMGRRRTEHQ